MLSPADIRRLHPEEFEFLWRALLRREHGNTYRHVDGHGVDSMTGETAYQIYHHQGASTSVVRAKFRDDLQAALKAREEGDLSFNRWIFVTTFAFKNPSQIEWLEAQKTSALPVLVETWGDEDLVSYAARHPDIARLLGLLHDATPAAPVQIVGAGIAAIGGAGGGHGFHVAGDVKFESHPAKSTGPKLSLRFDPKDPMCVSNEGGDETFRVQVVNDGDARATDVHVLLEDVQPPRRDLLHQRFHKMRGGTDTFDVSPSHGRAAVYVDVLYQRQHAGYGFVQNLCLKGAQWFQQANEITLVLRLEAEVPADPFAWRFVADERRKMRPV